MAIPCLEWVFRDAFDDLPRAALESRDDRDAFNAARGGTTSADHSRATTSSAALADRVLVQQIQSGDPSAYDTLFLTYFPRLVDFAMTLAVPRAIAEELVADVFLSIWRRRARWEPGGPVNGYLYRAVRNQASNTRRAMAREQTRYSISSPDDPPGMGEPSRSPDTRLEANELRAAVQAAIGALSPERQQIALLRWREGMAVGDIGQLLGLSRAAVQMQLNRIVAKLRQLLPDDFV
jgi:RNA polymerase sigma-70 factor (ECF subfamily)